MKKTILACIALIAFSSAVNAEESKGFGAGLVLGDTLGATGKLWLDKYSAVDLALGADASHGNFTVYSDYLYHGWKALPQPAKGQLAAYMGGGPRIEVRDDATEFGLRAVLGVSYFFPHNPIEIFGDLGPFFRMTPDGGVYLVGSVGIRFYVK